MHPLQAFAAGLVELARRTSSAGDRRRCGSSAAAPGDRARRRRRTAPTRGSTAPIRRRSGPAPRSAFLRRLMSRMKKRQHGCALLAAEDHGHFGVEGLAVGADGRHLDPPAQHRTLAGVQVAVDAVLLSGAHGGRKEHVGGLGAQHLLPRIAEGLLGRPVELGDDPFVVDGDDGVERRFEDGPFPGLGLGSARPAAGVWSSATPVDDGQAGRLGGLVRLHTQHRRLHVDEARRSARCGAGCGLPSGRSC